MAFGVDATFNMKANGLFIMAMFIIMTLVIKLTSIIMNYLDAKIEQRKTFLDFSYQFYFQCVRYRLAVWTLLGVIQEVMLSQEVAPTIAYICEALTTSSHIISIMSLTLYFSVQFILAMWPNFMFNYTHKEKTMFQIAKLVIFTVTATMLIVFKVNDCHAKIYYIWILTPDEYKINMVGYTQAVLFALLVILCAVFKLAVRVKYKREERVLPSNQILSSQVVISLCVCFIIINFIEYTCPESLTKVLNQFYSTSAIVWNLLSMIVFHQDLRGFATKKINHELTKVCFCLRNFLR